MLTRGSLGSASPGVVTSPSPGPVGRTLRRMVAHVAFLASSLLGDDIVGRRLRRVVLRGTGATLGGGAILHGGTLITAPWRLTLAEGVFVNRNCYLDLEAPLVVEAGATIGHGCTFVTTVHEIGPPQGRCGRGMARPIRVGPGAWLGANVTVLGGVTIGAGAVVAAGAVVRHDVPENTLVGGVPARHLRNLD